MKRSRSAEGGTDKSRSRLKRGADERCHHRLSQCRAPLSPNPMCEKLWTCVDAPLGASKIFWNASARSRVLTCVRP